MPASSSVRRRPRSSHASLLSLQDWRAVSKNLVPQPTEGGEIEGGRVLHAEFITATCVIHFLTHKWCRTHRHTGFSRCQYCRNRVALGLRALEALLVLLELDLRRLEELLVLRELLLLLRLLLDSAVTPGAARPLKRRINDSYTC